MTEDERRLEQARTLKAHWRRWGPYVSDRQWGTVREDYSPDGTAWEYFPFVHARSRAYRWGEDGIAGICDNHQSDVKGPEKAFGTDFDATFLATKSEADAFYHMVRRQPSQPQQERGLHGNARCGPAKAALPGER